MASWQAALELTDDDLQPPRRGSARTRRAYGVDLGQFARWAAGQGLRPEEVGPKAVRRYIAQLSANGCRAERRRARKLAALRALFASQREHGRISQNPADLVSTPRRPSHLPRVLSARADGAAAGRHPGLGARSSCATGRCSSWPTRAGCAREELVSLKVSDVDHDAEQLRVEGKGRKTRVLPVGEPAMAAVGLYWSALARR